MAYIDLGASMVLSVSAPTKQRQERLDALGEAASQLLPSADDPLAKSLSLSENSVPQVALMLSLTDTTAYIRSTSDRGEALCCSCTPDVAVDAMLGAARAVLSEIAAAE